MTALTRVSQAEMKRRTGFGKALGYAFPEKDEILIRKNLPKKVEREVLAHEEEHIERGEEGPFLGALIGGAVGLLKSKAAGAIIGGGLSLLGASKKASAAKSAAGAQANAANQEIAYAKETRDLLRKDQEPYRKAGATALDALMSLTGLGGGGGGQGSAPAPRGVDPAVRQEALGRQANFPQSKYASAYGRPRTHLRYNGGAMAPNTMYNINELGPENVYSGGAVSRNPNPMTIDGQTGYVQPHGRAAGGFTEDMGVLPPGREYGPPPAGHMPGGSANTTAINPQTGYPNENPGGVEGGYQFQTEPGYQFRFEEGQRALDRGAAARGGLLSGGYARKAIRYGQGFASNEYTNVYNRIANIAGLGQTANQANMYGALNTSGQVGNALSNQGAAMASGYTAQGNAWSNAANDIASLPWGSVFKPKSSGPIIPPQESLPY